MAAINEIAELATEPHRHFELSGLPLDSLKLAVAIYLEFAYRSRPIPPAVSRRLIWADDCCVAELVGRDPFERSEKCAETGAPIFALRLGNESYPHMKLQLQPWPDGAGFMLSVNTHDQISGLRLGMVDAEAFQKLQAENQRLKEAIERAWDQAGLPTFLRYLRDYLSSRAECPAESGMENSTLVS
jgi:hypothetical protein